MITGEGVDAKIDEFAASAMELKMPGSDLFSYGCIWAAYLFWRKSFYS